MKHESLNYRIFKQLNWIHTQLRNKVWTVNISHKIYSYLRVQTLTRLFSFISSFNLYCGCLFIMLLIHCSHGSIWLVAPQFCHTALSSEELPAEINGFSGLTENHQWHVQLTSWYEDVHLIKWMISFFYFNLYRPHIV